MSDEYMDPSFVATVSAFRLDTYEITVGRFRAFVADYPRSLPATGAGKNPNDPTDPGWDIAWTARMPATSAALTRAVKCGGTYQAWTDTPDANETKPVNCITWYEAFAFCIWDGGRLPTEAEWNYAAAGGDEQRVYPWSSPPTSTKIDETFAVYGTNGKTFTVSPVGSKPKGTSKWGQADLGGSVSEWTMDWFRNPYRVNPCTNCAERSPGDLALRVLRGGDVSFAEPTLRTSERSAKAPAESSVRPREPRDGARCARTP